jgi:tetratricopeptide (TPR) repeat protein
MIQWGEPLWLIVLVIPALLVLLDLGLRLRAKRKRDNFASKEMWQRLSPGRSTTLRRFKRYIFAIALVALIVGLANPRVGTRYEDVTREGIDIILVVDVSKSMDSQDIRPSRLGKTRYELAKFIQGLKGDRIGIVPFAGTAYPLLPLTLDYTAGKMFLDLMSTDLIPTPGTAIADAIEKAAQSFPMESSRGKAIVLVSDGEDHEGDATKAAEAVAKVGIKVFTIGMAQGKGDPIPVYNDEGVRTSWMSDSEGNIVTSKLNEDILRDIAMATGASYHRAGQGGNAFNEVYSELFEMDREEFETKRITGHEDRFQPILLLALILFVIQAILPDGRRNFNMGTKIKNNGITSVIIFMLLTTFSSNALAENAHTLVKEGNKETINGNLDEALVKYLEAKTTRDSLRPELDYNLGGVFARNGDYARADSLWKSLPEDSRQQLRARAAYNRGTAMAKTEQYDKAIPSLIDALKLDPNDQDAKKNLELALRRLQQQEEQEKEQNEDGEKQENEDQEQQEQQKPEDQEEEEQQEQEPQPQDQQTEEEQQQQQMEEMEKEMAEKLLDQLKQDEKELLKKVIQQQVPASKKKSAKPW